MVAQVIINSNVKKLNKIFDYKIPITLEKSIHIGARVLVPFGGKNKIEEGFVIGIIENSKYNVKDIIEIQNTVSLTEDNIELAQLMAKRYFCNISDCIKLMLPPGTTTKNIENRISDKNLNYVYLKKDIIEIEENIENNVIKSEKQKKVLYFLMHNDGIHTVDLEVYTDTTASVLKTLEKNGYIEIVEEKTERNPFNNIIVKKTANLKLTDEQQQVFDNINKAIQNKKYKEALIYGITGAGKTEIYLQLIGEVLKQNKSSIMLVPEISLTPQMVERFVARFGTENVAVLHSKLSIGERYDQWNKINNGESKIIIGARSAIFAPVQDIGLIIIDEEHDGSYKSDTNPRYNAKDLAGYIAKKNNIPLVLGTATPDIVTYYKAQEGVIDLLQLTKRANNALLPNVQIVDLRQELANGNKSILSVSLYKAIEENIKNKTQTILFLNRRGHSTFVICRDCGYVVKCKNCNVVMTYHSKQDRLKCHYCGHEEYNKKVCPECNGKNIKFFGTGTQRLEEEIKKLFPNATTIRMDNDTVKKKNSHEEILKKFKNENIDILIGTQMVVKGHHFPNVTLVGVISADNCLYMEDFRASEKTFQLLTQVAGRAGRESLPGKVFIQTYNPEHFAIQCSCKQNYDEFYDLEIEMRKMLKYPPFCDIISIVITDLNIEKVKKVSNQLYKEIMTLINKNELNLLTYKPLPCPIDKINNKHRWRIILKGRISTKLIDIINEATNKIKFTTERITIDINPVNLL